MTGWRWTVAAAALVLVPALAGCTSNDSAASPRPTTQPSPTSTSPSASDTPTTPPVPRPQHHVVPAVMLSSVIRTPDGPIRTGIKHPATFIQTRTGFVVQDTAGTTYAVEGGEVRRIGHADPGPGLALIADPGGRVVAWLVAARTQRVAVYDAVSHRETHLHVGTLFGNVSGLVLDQLAAYMSAERPGVAVRFPLGGEAGTAVAHSRRIRLLQQHRLSPTGAYTISDERARRLTVRRFPSGRDVTPAIPDGPVRQLVWLRKDTFTIEVETASLISPPDGDVWHLLTCSIPSGTCGNALTGVTGTALSIPGTPIRSSARD